VHGARLTADYLAIRAAPLAASVQSDQIKKPYNLKEKEEWILILKKIIGQDPPARQDFAQYQIQPA
jgi:hypothetical protein